MLILARRELQGIQIEHIATGQKLKLSVRRHFRHGERCQVCFDADPAEFRILRQELAERPVGNGMCGIDDRDQDGASKLSGRAS